MGSGKLERRPIVDEKNGIEIGSEIRSAGRNNLHYNSGAGEGFCGPEKFQ
jgi:hypothetical protein